MLRRALQVGLLYSLILSSSSLVPCRVVSRRTKSERKLPLTSASFDSSIINPVPITVGSIAVAVMVLTIQNDLTSGRSGLGAFLKDGSGFQGSGYQPNTKSKDAPLAWLKLPKFDFVEVFGAENEVDLGGVPVDASLASIAEAEFESRLNSVAALLRACLAAGDYDRAAELRKKLEIMLENSGFEYRIDREGVARPNMKDGPSETD